MVQQLDVKRFETLLLDKRHELLKNISELDTGSIRSMAENMPQIPSHPADVGTDTFELDNNAGLMEKEREILRDVDHALERLEQGTYGYCGQCRKRIPGRRLKAIPWAHFCLACAETVDQEGI